MLKLFFVVLCPVYGGISGYETALLARQEEILATQEIAGNEGEYSEGNSGWARKSGWISKAMRQFVAIVCGESSNNTEEAAAIGSVILNRMEAKGVTFSDPNFVDKIGGEGQYNAIGGTDYNYVMKMSDDELIDSRLDDVVHNYRLRINGAFDAIVGRENGIDYSNGAYIWNKSEPQTGFNWNTYRKGIYSITVEIGNTTFFRYSDLTRTWP